MKPLLSFPFAHRIGHVKLSTRVVCISDTHSNYDFTLPQGDILVHAGDLTRIGTLDEFQNLFNWFKTLIDFRLKIFIAGNHDCPLDNTFYETNWRKFHRKKQNTTFITDMFNDPTLERQHGIIYLKDQAYIDQKTKLKFYGSPWQPEFRRWAFNVKINSKEIHSIWNKIPLDTDVLITHTPPYGILDLTMECEHVGCKILYDRIELVKPKLHVFGHIHESYGQRLGHEKISTIFVNASICNTSYRSLKSPIVVEL